VHPYFNWKRDKKIK